MGLPTFFQQEAHEYSTFVLGRAGDVQHRPRFVSMFHAQREASHARCTRSAFCARVFVSVFFVFCEAVNVDGVSSCHKLRAKDRRNPARPTPVSAGGLISAPPPPRRRLFLEDSHFRTWKRLLFRKAKRPPFFFEGRECLFFFLGETKQVIGKRHG